MREAPPPPPLERRRRSNAAAARPPRGPPPDVEELSEAYTDVMRERMGSAVLTYRHEDGMNYSRILDDLIVGSCLQTPADLDAIAGGEDVRTVMCLQVLLVGRMACCSRGCRRGMQHACMAGLAAGGAGERCRRRRVRQLLRAAAAAAAALFPQHLSLASMPVVQEDSDMAYFDLDVSPILERCASRGGVRHVRHRIRCALAACWLAAQHTADAGCCCRNCCRLHALPASLSTPARLPPPSPQRL